MFSTADKVVKIKPSKPQNKEGDGSGKSKPSDKPEDNKSGGSGGEPSGEANDKKSCQGKGSTQVKSISADEVFGGKEITVARSARPTRGTGEVIGKAQGDRIREAEGVEVSKTDTDKWKDDLRKIIPQKELTPRTKIAGSGIGEIYQRIHSLVTPVVNWRQQLKQFIGQVTDKEYFKMPSRRSAASSDYRTGLKEEDTALNHVAVALDVSGSIAAAFPELAAEVVGICMARRIKTVSVLPFASDVHDVFQIKNGRKPTPNDFAKVRTGGGTEAIGDVMEWIRRNANDRPDVCVIMTDGYLTNALPDAPRWGKKTIWLVFDNPGFTVPSNWGRVIHAIGDPGYWKSV